MSATNLTESEQDIEKAIQASLKLTAPDCSEAEEYLELRSRHVERDLVRLKAAESFHKLSPLSVGAQLAKLAQPPSGIAGCSELFFFLRFFWPLAEQLPEKSTFFCDPASAELTGSEESTFSLLLECQPFGQTPQRSYLHAWRQQLDSKLANLTACGHLADTLLSKVFFESPAQQAACSVSVAAKSSGLFSRKSSSAHEQFLQHLKKCPPDHCFVIRVEVANCHVLLLDIPVDRNACYRIESAIRICDCRITAGRAETLVSRLMDHGSIDKFEVFRYDPLRSHTSLCDAYLAAFHPDRLSAAINSFRQDSECKVTWTDVLDAIYLLNMVAENHPGIWSTPMNIFERIFSIQSPARQSSL